MRSMLGAPPAASGGPAKKSSHNPTSQDATGKPGDPAGAVNPLLPPGLVAGVAASPAGDTANAANPEPAGGSAALSPTAAGMPPAADSSRAAASALPSAAQGPTAFEARLTPKAPAPEAAPAPADSTPVVPAGSSGSAAGGDLNQNPESKSYRGNDASPGAAARAVSGNRFLSDIASPQAVAVQAAGAADRAGAAGAAAMPAAPPTLAEPPASSAPAHVRDLTVRIAPPDSPVVDLQVNQRQGQVFVAVRTSDESLQSSLRQELPQLVNSLNRAGFHAETFVPGEAAIRATGEVSSGASAHDPSPGSGGDSRQEPSRQPPDQQQRQREQMHNRWLAQMED